MPRRSVTRIAKTFSLAACNLYSLSCTMAMLEMLGREIRVGRLAMAELLRRAGAGAGRG